MRAELMCRCMGGEDSTLTFVRDRQRPRGEIEPYLFLALQRDRLLAGGVRYCLSGVNAVLVGRDLERRSKSAAATLSIGVADGCMSRNHARLARTQDGWMIEDLGSKNGTLVNGAAVQAAALADRDLIEVGQTFFRFREMESEPDAPAVLDAAELADRLRSLRTLLPRVDANLGRLEAIARSGMEVLIGGESGTGKEVLARDIHAMSGRRGPFLGINCGAIPAGLVESELFGHRRGAFSGADEDRPGVFRNADGGTLLLDEIGDLPAPAQVAILRVLQEKEVLSIGSARPVKIDVRVIAATNHDLRELASRGKVRPDLLARISGFRIELAPLRERLEDMGLLLADILQRGVPQRAAGVHFDANAARSVFEQRWPLNIRELEKSVLAALVLAGEQPITAVQLRSVALDPAQGADPCRDEVVRLLREHGGNVSAVARAMGKARMQVQRWMARYGIDAAIYRG